METGTIRCGLSLTVCILCHWARNCSSDFSTMTGMDMRLRAQYNGTIRWIVLE